MLFAVLVYKGICPYYFIFIFFQLLVFVFRVGDVAPFIAAQPVVALHDNGDRQGLLLPVIIAVGMQVVCVAFKEGEKTDPGKIRYRVGIKHTVPRIIGRKGESCVAFV